MILAEDELAISAAHDETIVLADGLEPGTPLAGVLPIATEVLELEITPNRPDCLGVYGVAREVARGDRRGAARRRRGRTTRGSLGRRTIAASRSSSRRPTCARASPRASSRT